jgi:hypothetical protein
MEQREEFAMRGCIAALVLLASSLGFNTTAAAGSCTLVRESELPVEMVGRAPVVTISIDGTDLKMILDSGSFYSSLGGQSAAALSLKVKASPMGGVLVHGVDGVAVESGVAHVKALRLPGFVVDDYEFLVVGRGDGGLIGQDVLRRADVEYDLGHNVVRLMQPKNCGQSPLAYWATDSQPYSVQDFASVSELNSQVTNSHIRATIPAFLHTDVAAAYINGIPLRVQLDSGSAYSWLSTRFAAKLGITPDAAGVKSAGSLYGIDGKPTKTWLANFASFKLGQEEIHNARLRIGRLDGDDVDMLIGADFFLSHRIYVANSQHKIYFTYNGGPVFDQSDKLRTEDSPTAAANTTPEPVPESALSAP